MLLLTFVTSLLATTVLALPSATEKRADSVLAPRAICTPASGAASGDDTPAIAAAIKSCGAGGTIVLPAGKTYNMKTMLDFTGCVNCDFQIEGLLKASGDTTLWDGIRAMIYVGKIAGVKIRSLTGTGVIDGNGQNSYDRYATDTGFSRPTVIYISGGSNIVLDNFRMKNAPSVFVNLRDATKVATFSNLNLDATSKSTILPKNTDGFDIGESTYATLTNIAITNQDDCIAFKPGANYALADGITCTGSHGISIGSLGKENPDTVQNVIARNIKMINSTKAAGIKTYPPGNGHALSTVSNVTFSGFTVQNCDYAIQIQSCYGETAAYCAANPGNAQLTGITFDNFSGTTSTKYSPTTGMLNCGSAGKCDVKVSKYTVKAGSGTGVVLCTNMPSTLGVACTAGATG
ncbi:putative endo-xylogalacturonan hydrolase A [Leptodontidium sp. 2 PMI_412]|nr:putative endo-xylogalacturonan hydrolase A [Leptodontidium sp. 2 PMI_412]